MFEAGFFIVPLMSMVMVFVWAALRHGALALLGALVFPPIAAALFYWAPLIGVADKSEYAAWFGAAALMWLALAWPASLILTLGLRWRRGRRLEPADQPADHARPTPLPPERKSPP